jgi:nicotinamide mononucleotide adenylyltransferase
MIDRGVIHGRFQVLHNDHLSYLLAGMSRCRHLIVGITNPDPMLTRDDPADPNRSSPLTNPLTYFERYTMVREVLLGAGLDQADFSVVPFPVNLPALYRYYVPLDATFYLTIYDEWGRRKLEQFTAVGLKTEVLWTKDPGSKGLSGGEIRRRMAFGEAWEHLVPKETAKLMKKWGVPGRLKKLYD